jgi:hypothetical protein
MADTPEIADLKAFKVELVKERRRIVKAGLEVVTSGNPMGVVNEGSTFLALQSEIDAVDRAILDEEKLRPQTSSSAELRM